MSFRLSQIMHSKCNNAFYIKITLLRDVPISSYKYFSQLCKVLILTLPNAVHILLIKCLPTIRLNKSLNHNKIAVLFKTHFQMPCLINTMHPCALQMHCALHFPKLYTAVYIKRKVEI